MLLECPECGTDFRIPDGALSGGGRKVRCSKCSFQWFAEERELKEEPAASAAPAPEPAPEPEEEEITEELVTPKPEVVELGSEGDAAEEDTPEDDAPSEEAAEDDGEDIFAAIGLENEATEPVIEGAATHSKAPLVIALSAACTVLLITSLFTFRDTLSHAGLGGLYSILGMNSTDGLKLTGLAIGKVPMGQKVRYAIKGSVINQSDEERVIPTVRIRLIDAENHELKSWEFTQEGTMKPGEEKPFNASRLDSKFGDQEHAFVVDIGNGMDIMLRD